MKIVFRNTLGLDYGIVYRALLLLVIFFLPIGYIHESGHALGCLYGEGKYLISFSITGEQSTICSGNINDEFLYHFAGGSLAAAVSAIPLVFWNRLPPYVKIISLSFAIGQGLNGFVESVFYESYITQSKLWSIVFAEVGLALFFGLVMKYARIKK
ncbi:MAG: hypothetical protein ABI340_02685 [Nitrososphaera sp.]